MESKRRRRRSSSSANGFPLIIDMQEFEGLAEKIVKACEEWGCFRVVNHGVPPELMSEMKTVARSLLDLPEDIKNRTAHPESYKGYVPPTPANPLFETLGIYDTALPGIVDDFCHRISASPHQREIVSKYIKSLQDLVQTIVQKLVQGLGLGGTAGCYFNGWPYLFSMNKYNFNDQSLGLTGVVMHSDVALLTILQDDEEVNGLEAVYNHSGEIVPLNPVPGTFVINIGDMFKVWSNGRFCNVKHRVQCNEPKVRVSISLFVLGPTDRNVEAPSELTDSHHPHLYVPFNFYEYRTLRTSKGIKTGELLELYSATNINIS